MNARAWTCSLSVLGLLTAGARAQTPNWIWHPQTNAPAVFFRKTFRTPPLTWNSRLTVSADDAAEVYLNGVLVAECTDWRKPLRSEVSVRLNQGANVIAARARSSAGNAGLLVHLNVGGQTNFVSDASWLAATNEEPNWSALSFNAAHWTNASVMAPHGAEPWGDVLRQASATPAESLKVPEGFAVELLRSSQPGEGSWVCMAFDDQGRLIVSPEGDTLPLLRMSLKSDAIEKVEPIPAPARFAMGLLQTPQGFYLNARGPQGAGLYRLTDRNGNDRYDAEELEFIKKFEGSGEHGYHALALGPDRKIYILNGNGTKVPPGLSAHSPHRHYAEDALTGERGPEAGQDGSKAPACHVLRYDPATGAFDLFAGGMRNAYDFDFSPEGELFSFDSDMEWDWGTPWYKATRILHVVSGGEYGWRDGTRMWSDDYPDGLPSVVYAGIGSPTGVKFGTRSHFPEKYRRALFAQDWSYGRIFAVHLEPQGASYTARRETFLEGRPLNLTSLAFGPDGAMYFITGGRGTQSGLYRVRHKSPAPVVRREPSEADRRAANARELRQRLEFLQTRDAPESVQFIWPQFDLKDRFVRFAAGVALEAQNPAYWRKQALEEAAANPALHALRALARVSGPEVQPDLLRSLARFSLGSLSEEQLLHKLRILQITFSRHGLPSGPAREALAAELDANYPSKSWPLNRELSRLLLRLEAPGAVAKSIDLLKSAATQEEQMHFIEQLRNVPSVWTIEDRRAFFAWFTQSRERRKHPEELAGWFKDAGRSYVDGAYFDKYLRDFRREAIATLTPDERRALEPLLAESALPAQGLPATTREFVREWKMEDFLDVLEAPRTANLARGRQAFVDAQCLACHRFGNDGGMAGPELTGAGSKYSARDVLESILEPSKVLSDQYQNHTVVMTDGDSYSGRLLGETESTVTLETDRISGAKEVLNRKKVVAVRPSPLSPMPEGLVNVLGKDELLDLIAYVRGSAK